MASTKPSVCLAPWLEDPISRAPEVDDDYGRAWCIAPFEPTMIAQWLLEAPWANPLWHSYVLTLTVLCARDRAPKAPLWRVNHDTHEIVLSALDPTWPREPMSAQGDMQALKPPNFSAAFEEREPGEAVMRVRLAVWSICAGLLDPDMDNGRAWDTLFGANAITKNDRP